MHVYVLEADHGCKIGRSIDPTKRLKSIEMQGGFAATRAWVSLPAKSAMTIEREAHAALADHRTHGEWFGIDFDSAVDAVCSVTPILPTNTFGARLRSARITADLTQTQLSVKTEGACSQANISKLESRNATGSEYTAQLARALGVDAYWLATGKGD